MFKRLHKQVMQTERSIRTEEELDAVLHDQRAQKAAEYHRSLRAWKFIRIAAAIYLLLLAAALLELLLVRPPTNYLGFMLNPFIAVGVSSMFVFGDMARRRQYRW